MDIPDTAEDGNYYCCLCICGVCVLCTDSKYGEHKKKRAWPAIDFRRANWTYFIDFRLYEGIVIKNVTKLLKNIAKNRRIRYTRPCSEKRRTERVRTCSFRQERRE